MNKEVSFSIAKLLKEKGFDIPCTEGWINYLTSFTGETGMPDDESNLVLDRLGNPHLIERPTIAEVIMWLYEKHSIWIYIKQGYKWEWYIETVANHPELKYYDGLEDSPTKAYEAAIKHTLEKLI